MKWLEIWAMLEVIGIVISILLIIVYAIVIWRSNK